MIRIRSLANALLLPALLIAMAACGGPPEPTPTGSSDTPAEQTAPAIAATDEAEAVAATDEAEAVAAALETVEEETDGTEVAPEIVLADAAEANPSGGSGDWQYREGAHFSVLTTAQGTSSSPEQIEIAEIFWYGCPHCFTFDPYLTKWQDSLDDDVSFVRIPVMWNPTNEIHARVFYTAESLGKLDAMHEEIFRSIHQRNETLTRDDDIRELFEKYGVSAEDFDKTFRSFAVDSKLKRARNLTQRYQVRSVPLLVVNGKFVVTGDEVKSFDDMLAVANELIEKERTEL